MWKFPSLSRDRTQAWLSLALSAGVCVGLGTATAQDEKKAAPAADAKSKAKAAPKGDEEPKKAVPVLPPEKGPSFYEVLHDANAENALENSFPELPGVALNNGDDGAIQQQAAAKANPDPVMIERWVKHFAAELTKKSSIGSLLAPESDGKQRASRGLDEAASKLMEPLRIAGATNPPNTTFLGIYRDKLRNNLPPLLDRHMFTRVQAIIVLALAADGQNAKLFVNQVANPDQLMIVKLWSLRGLSLITSSGQNEQAITGALQQDAIRAIIAYISAKPDADPSSIPPWPAQVRALEALGSLRLSTLDILNNKAEATTAALAILADPKQRLESRAQAAWAVGMLRVPTQVKEYNFSLLAWHIGRVAVAIADEIERTFNTGISAAVIDSAKEESAKDAQANSAYNITRVAYLADLIAFQAVPAFSGDPKARESGLNNVPNHPSIASARASIREIGTRVHALARTAIQLSRSVGVQVPDARKAFQAALKDLREYLEKNPPKSFALVPGGDEFRGVVEPAVPAPPAAAAAGGEAAAKPR